MTEINLEVDNRPEKGKHARNILAKEGKIPGVVYGKELGNMSIAVDLSDIKKIVRDFGTSKIIDLRVKGSKGGDNQTVMVKDIQYDPVRRELIHVDFQKIDMAHKVKTNVRVKLVGKPVGANRGGALQQQMRTVEVECLPAAIPESITVDVSALELGESLHVFDLSLPEGVKVTSDPDALLAVVAIPRASVTEPEVTPAEVKEATVDKETVKKEAADGAEPIES
ncbi:50S ribosomal protein L25 [Peptococcaceae bacterium 1198_IL3148]